MNDQLKWTARLTATRPVDNPGFTDLLSLLKHHYDLHSQAECFLGPYNARQRAKGEKFFYSAPTSDELKNVVKKGGVNTLTYLAFINSLVRFCETTKGLRALPTPHPSVIHSIQLPSQAFVLTPQQDGQCQVDIAGLETPLFVKGLMHPEQIRFIIVRPKLSKLGTASATNWEILFFKTNAGYIPDWVDSNINPRWAGKI